MLSNTKILLCSPYQTSKEYIQGGIVIWAKNVLDYYKTQDDAPDIEVVSFDRKDKKKAGAGISTHFRALSGVIDYIKPVRNTIQKLKTKKFDVLHLCTSASLSLFKDWVVVRKARRYGAKAIVHLHFGRIPEIAGKNNWEWKLLVRIAQMASDVVTMDMKSFTTLKEKGLTNVHYLPNPLAQPIIQQIESLKDSTTRERNKVCFVGHVIPTKGVRELVEACREIPDIKLYVIGKASPEMKTEMKQLAGDFQSMVFLDEIDHAEVIREMLSTEIFVLPTYTEGFPNVILESMACGCAIVTTPVGAIPEMLDLDSASPCGLCSAPKDVTGLRKNIQYFVDNPDQAKAYGQRAAVRVNEMYAMPIVWKQLVNIWTGNN
jgi:glycosyltransferase involved in cell wall biosynthesis